MRLCLLSTAVIALAALSCGGGSTAPGTPDPGPRPATAPAITAVTPAGSAGDSGAYATFEAAASPCPCTYAWTFESGVEPLASEATAPRVRLREPGPHVGRVVARNAKGESEGFPFAFDVR
ncbi:MAG TPA: hypothetical protein VEI97_05210, partial [bacterium]|nr:hypothetical protein [bacterium]